MPEPCDCPVKKNFDASKTPKKCSCPAGTHNTIIENQQEISESASSSNKNSKVAPNQPNMSQSSQNINKNGPNMLQSNQNQNDTSNQPGLLDSTSQNNVNGGPTVTEPWENCKCNFPEISPICKCSEAEDDVSGDRGVKHLRMAAIKDNEPLDEDKNAALIKEVEISTKDISPDRIEPAEGVKTEDDVPPESNLSETADQNINIDGKSKTEEGTSSDTGISKPTVDQSSLTEHKGSSTDKNIECEAQPDTELPSKDQSSLGENKGDTSSKDKTEGDISEDAGLSSKATEEQSPLGVSRAHPVEGDVPPDEGEIKEYKDLSKFICTCKKDKQDSNKTNQNLDTDPANRERTFIMVKPDGVQRGLVGKIIKKFEQKGFHLVALSFLWPSEELLKKHYAGLSDRPFFPGLIQYMSSGPVVPMVWEGLGIVRAGRSLLGATNPADSAAGTIRGDLCIQVGRNICHASDSIDSANNEIDLWFSEKELIPWVSVNQTWVYED